MPNLCRLDRDHGKLACEEVSKLTFKHNTDGIIRWDYKHLPHAGASVYEDMREVASHSYHPDKKELVSFDTPNIARTKTQYIVSNGLAGTMFWEVSINDIDILI